MEELPSIVGQRCGSAHWLYSSRRYSVGKRLMKIHAYRVVQHGPRSLGDVLKRLNALPLQQRVFSAARMDMRLESFADGGDYLYADFANPRSGHGPAIMTEDSPLQGIRIENGQSFGEDTSMVIHQPTGYVALQYNHSGPRIGRISQYLYAADKSFGGLKQPGDGEAELQRCGFDFGAVLTPNAYDKLGRMGIVRHFEFSVSLPGVRAQDRELGRSLSEILDGPLPEGVETISIAMSAGRPRDSKLGRNGVMRIVDDLQRLSAFVTDAKVKGKQDPKMRMDEVDLISDRLYRDVRISIGDGQRYSSQDRWQKIGETLHEWLSNGSLQSKK